MAGRSDHPPLYTGRARTTCHSHFTASLFTHHFMYWGGGRGERGREGGEGGYSLDDHKQRLLALASEAVIPSCFFVFVFLAEGFTARS